ncbi:hypothetical protein ABLE93_04670 [Xanthobacter sp. KR7-65]|uniref:hypothetical protein n=1 Tax=Xanthobacter sp. KR7-65 TaxID=3156612 RepID=UPI0032B62725
MANPSTGAKSSSIVRLRAGLLVLVASIILCGVGGNFVARQFGLGIGWALLLAVIIWVAAGMLIARLDSRIYYAVALAVTVLIGYLVYDFSASALGWPDTVSLVLGVLAAALLAFTFYDFRRLKRELRLWAYRR